MRGPELKRPPKPDELGPLVQVRDEVIATLKRGGVIPLDQTPTTIELLALLKRMRGTDA